MRSDQKTTPAKPDKPPKLLKLALDKFNAGDYFDCHELLETLWLDEPGPERELFKGILQIGIGLRHLQRDNLNGARQLLENGANLIEPFVPIHFGIDLLRLQREARAVLCRLQDPARPHEFIPGDTIRIIFN